MGDVTSDSLIGVAMSLPVLGLGILLGQQLKPRLNEINARRFVLALLLAAGCSALIGAIVG
jgi:TnpA family transposase